MKKYTERQFEHNRTVRKLIDSYLDEIESLEREITCLTITYEEMPETDPRIEELAEELETKEDKLYTAKRGINTLMRDGIVF